MFYMVCVEYNLHVSHLPCCHYQVTYQHQLRCFTVIPKSIIYTLQNLARGIGHPGTFCLLIFEYCEFGHTSIVSYCYREVCDLGCNLVPKSWYLRTVETVWPAYCISSPSCFTYPAVVCISNNEGQLKTCKDAGWLWTYRREIRGGSLYFD